MDITIGDYDATTGNVPVTFTDGDKTFTRDARAVLDNKGKYDPAGTQLIADALGDALALQWGCGVIPHTPPPVITPPEIEAPVIPEIPESTTGDLPAFTIAASEDQADDAPSGSENAGSA